MLLYELREEDKEKEEYKIMGEYDIQSFYIDSK